MTSSRQLLGKWGESLAADYLLNLGYVVLERNVRTPYGEIDLIARLVEESTFPAETVQVTVFVEVKTRSTQTFGLPEESVTARKRQHMIAAAQSYLQDHPDLGEIWRIDVIAIQQLQPDKPPTIHHFENAVY
jgi:putative endonuclease